VNHRFIAHYLGFSPLSNNGFKGILEEFPAAFCRIKLPSKEMRSLLFPLGKD